MWENWMRGQSMREVGFAPVARSQLWRQALSLRTWPPPGACADVSWRPRIKPTFHGAFMWRGQQGSGVNEDSPSWQGGWQDVVVLSSDLQDMDPAHYISENRIREGAEDEAHQNHQIPQQGVKNFSPLSSAALLGLYVNCHSHCPYFSRTT